ncbi:putative kinase [Escherichia coli]|uniref:Kinase n=1 Tax=Escherichia coli TaxID=562 RepID=A0AAX2KAY5_ECOLX|nr:putative kinase [Escherichia coli]
MWQAISRLLSEQLGEGEIELRNELPGGEVHGRMAFALCRT